MLLLSSAVVTFVYVWLKAVQQLNVVHGRTIFIMPIALCMGLCEVAIVLFVVRADTLWLGLANGFAGGLGAILAVRMYRKKAAKSV